MADRQQTFDHVRGSQIALLRECEIPAVVANDGRPVSGRSMKSVLLAIDSRAGKSGTCWASLDTLALDVGLKRRTIIRAMQGLRTLGLVIESIDPTDSRIHHRRICFANLEDFRAKLERRSRSIDGSTMPPSTGATGAKIGATRTATGATGAMIGATSNTQRDIKRTEGKERIHGGGPDEFLEMPGGRGWTLRPGIAVEDLNNPEAVQQLWELVLQDPMTAPLYRDREEDRRLVFALAHRMYRKRRELKNPIGMFLKLVQQGREALHRQRDDAHDGPWARKAVRHLDGVPQQPAAAAFTDPRAVELRDHEAARSQQAAALRAAFPDSFR